MYGYISVENVRIKKKSSVFEKVLLVIGVHYKNYVWDKLTLLCRIWLNLFLDVDK